MASLRDRLEAMRRERERRAPAASEPPSEGTGNRTDDLAGWERSGEFVFRREIEISPAPGLRDGIRSAADFFLDGVPTESLRWYDTETTGLSGGAGTIAFLFGCARMEGETLRLSQLFLADFPGEPEFLRQAEEHFRGDPLLLSYNGRAYDGPLLRGRFIMNRIPFELPRQFDLLFPARRLWRGVLPDCSLGSVERYVLARERSGDIPGALIPGVYFDFLAGRGTGDMMRVFHHNREDVLSLVDLFAGFGRFVMDPEGTHPADPAGLGILIAERDPDSGLPFLRQTALEGSRRALTWLSRYYKRAGLYAQAESLWSSLTGTDDYAALEMAKLLEHRKGDPAAALAITENIISRACGGGKILEELFRRRDRLRGKILRRGGGAV